MKFFNLLTLAIYLLITPDRGIFMETALVRMFIAGVLAALTIIVGLGLIGWAIKLVIFQ